MDLSENDQRVIAAIMLEASHIETYVTASIDDESITGVLINLKEEGPARKKIIKEFSIKSGLVDDSKNKLFEKNQPLKKAYSVTIQAVDAIYEIDSELIRIEKDIYSFHIVGPLRKKDRRTQHRSILNDLVESPIILEHNSEYILGMIKVIDHSFGALGVEIRTLSELDRNKDYKASGLLAINEHFIKAVECSLRRIKRINEKTDEKVFTYSAGLAFKNKIHDRESERLSQRVLSEGLKISVNSCLSPNFEIPILLENVAHSGFKGSVIRPQDKHLLWSGCGISFHRHDLKGNVVFADEKSIRVEWILSGGSGERVWSDLVSGTRSSNIDLNLSSAEELMTAFIRSGAAPVEYLQQLNLLGPNTIKGLSLESRYQEWFFKWIERDIRGKVKGHLAGYRLGDNLWCAGDFFSDPDQNQKISKNFSKNFFTHFVDFLQKKSPVPKVYAAWSINHPLWNGLEEFIKSNPQSVFANLMGFTFFLETKQPIKISDHSMFEEVKAFEIKKIEIISQKLKSNGVLEFAKSFDFDEDRFGSPRTLELFSANGFNFKRHYNIVSFNELEYLVIFSRVPFGVSPFNNTSIIYVLTLEGKPSDFNQSIANEIGRMVANQGIFPHRVVYLTTPGYETINSKLAVRTVIVDPRMWLHS